MPQLIAAPARIPVPGGKVIDEYVGLVSTSTWPISVAHMRAPAGWTEPAQAPFFDEITLVLAGLVSIDHSAGRLDVHAGQAVMARAGERVRYSVGPDGAEYVAICLPAFAPELAQRDSEE
jgi:hypothetical protein